MSDIGSWLEAHGLGHYAPLFARNAIDFDILEQITLEELKELEIPLGDRKRILNAVAALSEVETDTARRAPLRSTSREAERRQLTVMFCDLVDSTRLTRELGPEAYRELLLGYQDTARAAIWPYEGYIARYLGDGLLVYFGYPRAHEDDAERALRAGLEVAEAVEALESGTRGPLAVRIGIATGLVVVGDIVGEGASEEHAVLGETPNLAARLQGIAPPGGVVLSETTHRLDSCSEMSIT